MIRLISFILLLTLVVFLVNGFTEDLPAGAVAQINTSKGPVNAIVYAPDANRLAIANSGNILLYDAKTSEKLDELTSHKAPVLTLAFSANSEILASGGEDKKGRMWDMRTGESMHILGGEMTAHKGAINTLAFSENGEMFYSFSIEDGTLRSWNPLDGGCYGASWSSSDIVKSTTAVAFSKYGKTFAQAVELTMAIADKFEFAALFSETDIGDNFMVNLTKQVPIFTTHTEKIVALTISPSGALIATGSADWTIEVTKVPDKEPLKETDIGDPLWILKGHAGTVTSVVFSPSGKMLASGSADQRVPIVGSHNWPASPHLLESYKPNQCSGIRDRQCACQRQFRWHRFYLGPE